MSCFKKVTKVVKMDCISSCVAVSMSGRRRNYMGVTTEEEVAEVVQVEEIVIVVNYFINRLEEEIGTMVSFEIFFKKGCEILCVIASFSIDC